MTSAYKKYTSRDIGPGGLDCSCCGPAPGLSRKKWRRVAKKYEKRKAFKFELESCEVAGV